MYMLEEMDQEEGRTYHQFFISERNAINKAVEWLKENSKFQELLEEDEEDEKKVYDNDQQEALQEFQELHKNMLAGQLKFHQDIESICYCIGRIYYWNDKCPRYSIVKIKFEDVPDCIAEALEQKAKTLIPFI